MIVHNAADHEGAWWKNTMLRFQLRQATRFLTHNAGLASDLLRLVGDRPVAICAHPVFDDYPEPKYELPRVAALELLFFGLVRPYKGLDIALHALAASGLQDVRLTIVGEFWQGQEETAALIERLGLYEKVALVPRYVSDREAAEYFARCDAVIAPYRSVTGSGIVGLALRYGRPTIASNLPGLAEVISDGSTGWLFSASDIAALAALLATRVSRQAAEAMHSALEMRRATNSWDRFADATLDTLKPLPTRGRSTL
jgi:glycosyltransferase involved in cell wall biosynthesis